MIVAVAAIAIVSSCLILYSVLQSRNISQPDNVVITDNIIGSFDQYVLSSGQTWTSEPINIINGTEIQMNITLKNNTIMANSFTDMQIKNMHGASSLPSTIITNFASGVSTVCVNFTSKANHLTHYDIHLDSGITLFDGDWYISGGFIIQNIIVPFNLTAGSHSVTIRNHSNTGAAINEIAIVSGIVSYYCNINMVLDGNKIQNDNYGNINITSHLDIGKHMIQINNPLSQSVTINGIIYKKI